MIAFVTGFAAAAEANSITLNLNCILTTSGCTPSSSFGTITIDDAHVSLVPGAGDLYITVDLVGTTEKFRDLLLNYNGSAAQITAGADATNMLSPDGYTLTPYTGNLDVGQSGGQGWNSPSDPYSAILYGWNAGGGTPATTSGADSVALTLANFLTLDTLNNIYGAIHIQNLDCSLSPCPQGITTGLSIKVGMTYTEEVRQQDVAAPEPASLLLLGSGLAAGAARMRRRQRKQAA
jgi:hypothetical protein